MGQHGCLVATTINGETVLFRLVVLVTLQMYKITATSNPGHSTPGVFFGPRHRLLGEVLVPGKVSVLGEVPVPVPGGVLVPVFGNVLVPVLREVSVPVPGLGGVFVPVLVDGHGPWH